MADGDDEVAALQSRIEEIKADNAEVVSSMQTAEKDKIKQLALENDSKYSELESSSEARFNELKKTSDATIAKLTQEHEDDQAQLKKQSEAGSALSNDKMDSLQKECEATVAEMQAKIDEANEEETKTRLAMEEIANGISEAAKRGPAMLRSARDSLEKKQTRITDLEGQLTKLANEHKIYKNFYDGLDDTNKALDDERSTTETLRGEVAELEVTINTLENEKTNLAKDLAQAETAQAAADAERAATAEKFGTATEEAEKELKLRDVTVAEREDKITSLEQELSDLKEVADKANSEYSANISSSRNELSEQVATQTARAVKAEAEIVKLNTQLTEQGTRLDKEIAQKTATIRQLEQVRDELQVVVDEKHRGSNEIEEEHNKQVAKVESFKIKVDALEAELTAIKAQKEAVSGDLVAERTDLSSQINVLQNEKENLAATVERRDEEIDASNAAAADAREAANEAATELSALKIEYESIGTERDAITKQLDTVTESFNKQIEEVTGHFQSDREAAGASQEEKIQQLILSAKNSEENNQKQLGTMSESRAKIEKQNAELQQEMTLQQRKTKESNDNIIALKADLVKMNQVLAKNVKQFGQLAQDLETAGKVNDQLQKDLEQQKVDWNEEMKSIVQQRENLTVKIHELEDRVSEEVQKVADTREEGRSAIDNAEASALETKQREQKIEELEQQVSQMEAARDEAEELRTELREQHQSDIDASQEEKQNLDAKLSQVTQDLSECNATLDSTRAELIQARKDFSEEKVVRIALEGDATNGLLREKQLRETVEDKDRIIERMSSDHGDHHETGSGELIASQKVNLQLQQELKDAHEKNERNTMDISSWKAREGVARARADEGWAKADSEQARAGNIEEERQTLAAQLLEAQSMWKAEVAGKDDEIAGVISSQTVACCDMYSSQLTNAAWICRSWRRTRC
jgi:chromosome segregation ATPase